MKILNLFVLISLAFCSCEGIDGESEPPRFKPSEITFSYKSDSIVIKSSNKVEWWFDSFQSDGEYIADSSLIYRYEKGKEEWIWNVVEVEGEWFTLKKINNRTIRIFVKETTKTRNFSFLAYRGNSWQEITVIQYAKPEKRSDCKIEEGIPKVFLPD